ncbi:MAG: aconitate hydratase AcnA [Caulobacterales bacterium]
MAKADISAFTRDQDGLRWLSLPAFAEACGADLESLPLSLRIILEAALHGARMGIVELAECEAIAHWRPGASTEARFPIARVIMQDAAGLPLLADLAAARDYAAEHGSDPARVNLAVPASLIIDHAIIADHWGDSDALDRNMADEFASNHERYEFARWAERAFSGLSIIPPGNGIIHQIHLERIAEIVTARDGWALCDSVIGTDSHTTMAGGLGLLCWGVGGIEAETALLGMPQVTAIPEIVSVRLDGALSAGVFAADAALALTQMLRAANVVGAFVEFSGPGVGALSVSDRATISNMAPEYGATLALFATDDDVLTYLRENGRDAAHVMLAREHLTRQTLFGADAARQARYDRTLSFDLACVQPCVAGPSRPDELTQLTDVPAAYARRFPNTPRDGRIVLAAITSCTNTANTRSMIGAGLVARRAIELGLRPPAWVKTVFAPGSRQTIDMLARLNFLEPLAQLGFHVSAYGCGPCVGNSGALAEGVEETLDASSAVAAVLSGNRNFPGRIHPQIRAAYLMSPALVVAYALAGRIDAPLDIATLWPNSDELNRALATLSGDSAAPLYEPAAWKNIATATSDRFAWRDGSTFFIRPPFFDRKRASALDAIIDAAPLAIFGDNVTTDHISPVGRIAAQSRAGALLTAQGVSRSDLGAYSGRRVNHDVMMRGAFANPQLENLLVRGEKGPLTRILPGEALASIDEAAAAYRYSGCATVILAGRNYGAGSARDWAAKAVSLLGVRAVIAKSFERIHRSNLIALGVAPIESDFDFARIADARRISIGVDFGAAPTIGSAVRIHILADGHETVLTAKLAVKTASEIVTLKAGDMFQRFGAMLQAGADQTDKNRLEGERK